MSKPHSHPNYHFWSLIILALTLIGLGLVISWDHSQGWIEILWHICQGQLQNLGRYLPMAWQLVIPMLLLIAAIRGGLNTIRQIRATSRVARSFYPLRSPLPARLQAQLAAHNLAADAVIFLNLPAMHAFCLGFWRPHIWLTAGLVNLLSDEELAAVLAHEAHHCRRRDPLRLLISRALKSAFFFLPLVSDLAEVAELQQEIAADRSAIVHFEDDLPLLCALQKMLRQGAVRIGPDLVAFSSFNVTEARLRRLIYPPTPVHWRTYFSGWLINLGILIILTSTIFLSSEPVARPNEPIACTIEPSNVLQTGLRWPEYGL